MFYGLEPVMACIAEVFAVTQLLGTQVTACRVNKVEQSGYNLFQGGR